MKTWTSMLAAVVATAMVTTMAFAQAGGGAGAGGAGAPGAPAGAGAASGTSPGSPGGTGSTDSGGAATTGSPATGVDKARGETPPGGSTTGATTTAPSRGGARGSVSTPSASPHMASADFTGRHTMEGEVTKVDANKGHVTLKTAEGNMDLHFPASALSNVKKGDRMSVELALKPMGSASKSNGSPAASPQTGSKKADKPEKKY